VTDARLLPAAHSAAFLAEDRPLRREFRAPQKPRPAAFVERYESRALVYDCFWHADGQRILLVGPPPMNLRPELDRASYTALPSGTPLRFAYHPSLSTMITELSGAPAGTMSVQMSVGGQSFELPVQPNASDALAGKRVLFTMSRDNDLGWIREWAKWHQRMHGAEAIVFFDNGSTRYGNGEIEETLLGVDGIEQVAVQSWPYTYGMTDPGVLKDAFYILFLQVSSMSVALRRYAAKAAGLLNADIDELVSTPRGTSIFDLAKAARQGLVVMRGRYIEAIAEGGAPGTRTHRHFSRISRDPKRSVSRPRKWVIDPTRDWVSSLDVHPYMHWIEGRPWFGKSRYDDVFYRHFRGINTNWKDNRTDASAVRIGDTEIDAEWHTLAREGD
jgi:hypothetical protein